MGPSLGPYEFCVIEIFKITVTKAFALLPSLREIMFVQARYLYEAMPIKALCSTVV